MDLGTSIDISQLMERHIPASEAVTLNWYIVKIENRQHTFNDNVWISKNTENEWSWDMQSCVYRFENEDDAFYFKMALG